MASDADLDLDLVASDKHDNRVVLFHLRFDEATEMVGVWLAPNGNRKKIISVLKAIAVKWVGSVRRGNSSRKEAWTNLHTNISAKLKYPLPACALIEQEYKSIMHPTIRAVLPKSGVAASMVTEVRDGPSQSGGASVISLYHYMGTSRIVLLVEYSFRRTHLGKIIRVCIEDIVLDAGLYGLLWNIPFLR